MPLWKRLWLLFTVIWVVVAALNVATILAFSEGLEHEKYVTPLILAVAVPAAAYFVAWLWSKVGKNKP
jgi:ACR3 family arsenite efflux pump ArsB